VRAERWFPVAAAALLCLLLAAIFYLARW